MTPSTVTSKGQIVIPSQLRRRHGITKGTRVCFVESGADIILRPITDEYIASMQGSLASKGRAMKVLLQEKMRERNL